LEVSYILDHPQKMIDAKKQVPLSQLSEGILIYVLWNNQKIYQHFKGNFNEKI